MAVPLRKRVKRAVRSWLLRAVFRMVGLLPLRPALSLGSAIAAVGWAFAGRTRRLALASLAVAFPELSEEERRRIARRCFRHLGWALMEVATARGWDRDLERYVTFADAGDEMLRGLLARGKGLVFVTGHVGNWELLARRCARAGIPNATIAKAGDDPKMNELAARFRAEGGTTTLWREDAGTGRAIIRTLREGKALGILIDQDTKVQGIFVPFFGRLAWTPRAPGDLALRFGAPVIVCTSRRRGDRPGDGHVLEVVEVPYDPAPADREAEVGRIVAACSAILESAMRRSPAEWVWMHERWKTRPGPEPVASAMPKSREVSGS